jgi:hypothetical protein
MCQYMNISLNYYLNWKSKINIYISNINIDYFGIIKSFQADSNNFMNLFQYCFHLIEIDHRVAKYDH